MKILKGASTVIKRDFANLTKKKLPLNFRLTYPFSKYISLSLGTLKKTKTIHYLNNNFKYDNWTMPISLQAYPHEIVYKILENLNKPINTILDIGGNIGQFSLTMNHFLPKAKIFVFEPNPIAYSILLENIKNKKTIKAFNYGIGKPGIEKLYFMDNRSATGSIIKDNTETSWLDKTAKLKETKINIVDDIKKSTGIYNFDLIKIDVEGYEFETIKYMKNVKTKYLFMEISGNRKKNYKHSELFTLLRRKFGEYDLLYQSEFNKNDQTFDMLLELLY